MVDCVLALDPCAQEQETPATTLARYKSHIEQLMQMAANLQQQVTTLRQSEAIYRATFEQAAVGIAHVAPDGRWLRVNQRLCQILGYRAEELLNTSFQALTHPADLQVDMQGVAQVLAGEIQTYSLHKRYRHKQGHTIWANLTVSLVQAAEGVSPYFVSVVEDITQLKQAEAALQQSEERYRRMVEEQTDLLCRFDTDLKLTFVSQPYSRAFGQSPAALIGRSILDLILPEEQARALDHLAPLDPNRRVGSYENRVRLADGTLRAYQWTTQVLLDERGQMVEYQSVGRDITKRKQAEEAEREQRRYAEALRDSLAALTSTLDIEQVLKQILLSAATVVPSEGGSIVLFENNQGRVAYLRGFTPAVEAFFADYRFALDSPIFQRLLTLSQPYFVADTHNMPGWVVFPLTTWIRASIGIPIELRGQVIGLLIADSGTPGHFKPTDIEKLQAFARYASLALENAHHVAKLEERVAARTAELRYYAGLQEQVSDAVIATDLDFRIRSWNRAAEAVYGWRAAEVMGKSVTEVLRTHYDTPDQRAQAQQALLQQGWWHGEVVQCHQNGTALAILGSVSILKDEAGVPIGVVAVNHDITARKRAEAARQRDAAEISALYNNAPCGYHSLDPAGYIVQINDTELRWLGYRREEIVGRRQLSDFLTPRGNATFAATFPQFKAQGWIKDVEHDLICRDGRVMTILLSAVAVYDEQGQFQVSQATLYDITAHKQAQQIIRDNEKKFRLLVEVAPLAILITDHNGQITLINEHAEQLFGYPRAELLGVAVEVLVPDHARIAHPQHRQAYLAAPGVRQMAGDRDLYAMRKDGTTFPVEIQLSFAENQVGCFIRDITERKEAAAALREQRDFLQLVIDHVPNLITVNDQHGAFQLVNEGAAQIYGLTVAEMVGKTEAEVNPNPAEVTLYQQTDQAALLSKQVVFRPEQLILGRYYQTSKIPLQPAADTPTRLLVVSTDITKRKETEVRLQQSLAKEKELSALKSRFVSMASHEFRTPLTTIFGLTEILLNYRHKLTEAQWAQRLTKIQEQIHYLNTIMENVLQLARSQSPRTEFKPTLLDLDDLCRQIIDEFQSQPLVATRLVYHGTAGAAPVPIDQQLMRQLINNLVSNALKYSPPARPVVVKLTDRGRDVQLQVCDEGIGIPEADMPQLFEPFHRATNVGVTAGTGLGLVIAKEAVDLHGGTIVAESQVGVGTTFTVTLPVAVRREEAKLLV